MREHGPEAVRGLPGPLPAGEHLLWQGAPAWRRLAWQGFGLPWLLAYFAALAVLNAGVTATAGGGTMAILQAAALPVVVGAALGGMVLLYAWGTARVTVYSVTSQRLLIRGGLGFEMTVNIPFRTVQSVNLRRDADGHGDLRLHLAAPNRVALLALWPHVRFTRFRRPEPMLRALPDAEAVARLLGRALAATGGSVTAPSAQVAEPRHAAPSHPAGLEA